MLKIKTGVPQASVLEQFYFYCITTIYLNVFLMAYMPMILLCHIDSHTSGTMEIDELKRLAGG